MIPPEKPIWGIEDNAKFPELDERQNREVNFALLYADHFNHGTPGHNHLIIIATLAKALLEARDEKE